MSDKLMFHGSSHPSDDKKVITLSRRDMRAAMQLLTMLAGLQGQVALDLSEPTPPPANSERPSRERLIARARQEYDDRRRRHRHFGRAMFGEPAWDMLLALYLLDADGPRQTIGSLLHQSGASISTANRWLDYAIGQGLIDRDPHPTDRRTAFVKLSARGRELLEAYLFETIRNPA